MTPTPQNYKNHASFDPLFHAVSAAGLLFLFVLSIVLLVQNLHGNLLLPIFLLVLSVLLIVLATRIRVYPLKVQDRIIRLEEQLRLHALLPEPLRKRIPELNVGQLVALRFASDEEVPALVQLALEHNLDRKQIKEKIQNWRPDHFRV